MRCSKCDSENPAGKKFCGDCGAALANWCPQCGSDNPAGKRFCGECGAALGASAGATKPKQSTASPIRVAETPAAENIEGERKTVTALFADIKGSMDLMEDLDPEEARAIVDPAIRLMIDAAHRYDGYVVQSTGDGIFALFGAPVAHEDHPQRALYSALRMQDEVKRYAERLRAEQGGAVRWYLRYSLSLRDVEELLAERGLEADHTPIWRWVQRYGPELEQPAGPSGSDRADTSGPGSPPIVYRALAPGSV
jgi:hypothetical protein